MEQQLAVFSNAAVGADAGDHLERPGGGEFVAFFHALSDVLFAPVGDGVTFEDKAGLDFS